MTLPKIPLHIPLDCPHCARHVYPGWTGDCPECGQPLRKEVA